MLAFPCPVDLQVVRRRVEAEIRDLPQPSLADRQIIVGPNFHIFASESTTRYGHCLVC